jgi:hypothetical protein
VTPAYAGHEAVTVAADVRSGRRRAREKASSQRVFRGTDDPNRVVIQLEFDSARDAEEARRRLVESGVLDRFEDKHGRMIVVETAS